jgi:hypothetical protein
MGSKRLDVKIRILLFLFCTIGILYISMKLLYRVDTEGFQVYDNCIYDTSILFGKGMWKCPSNLEAMALLSDPNINLNDKDAVCYLTPTPSNPEKKYYTCYQRPAGKTFSDTEGVFVPNNSLYDLSPTNITSDITQVCADYNGELAKFVAVLQSTVSYQGMISTGTQNITGAIKTLSDISTSYCPNSVNDPANSKYTFCQTLNSGIGIFTGLQNGPISDVSTQITGIFNKMSTMFNNQYLPAYAGFPC